MSKYNFPIIVILWAVFHSVSTGQNNSQKKDIDVDTRLYFPKNTFFDTINTYGQVKTKDFCENRMKTGYSRNTELSHMLGFFFEPIIFNMPNYEGYRFFWPEYSGSSHGTIIIRIEKKNEQMYCVMKYRVLGKVPDELTIRSDSVVLQDNDMRELVKTFDSINFWRINSIEQTNKVRTDAVTVIIEGRKPDQYHVLTRNGRLVSINDLINSIERKNYSYVIQCILKLTRSLR